MKLAKTNDINIDNAFKKSVHNRLIIEPKINPIV